MNGGLSGLSHMYDGGVIVETVTDNTENFPYGWGHSVPLVQYFWGGGGGLIALPICLPHIWMLNFQTPFLPNVIYLVG